MHSLPEKSLSATFKNLSLLFLIFELNYPFRSISEYLFKRHSRDTFKLENLILALSTPLSPNLCPKSSSQTYNLMKILKLIFIY